MKLVEFGTYYDIGEALIVSSGLKSAGFHPSFNNFYYAHMAYLELIALGGLIMYVPQNELADARTYIQDVKNQPELDYDPIKISKYGRWKSTLLFTGAVQSGNMVAMALLIFVKPKYLVLLVFAWGILELALGGTVWLVALLLVFLMLPISMLLHAEYVALPRLERNRNHEH